MTFRASCPHPSPTAPAPTSPDPRLLLDVVIFVILLLFQVLHDFIQYLRSFFLLRGVCPGRGGSEEGKKKSKNYNLEPPWEGLEVAGYLSRGRSSSTIYFSSPGRSWIPKPPTCALVHWLGANSIQTGDGDANPSC